MAVIVIPIVRIIAPPGICKRSPEEKPVIVKSTVVEPAVVESATVEPAIVEPATVEPATVEPATVKSATVKSATVKSATVKPTKSAAVEATAATVETSGVGRIWLAERGSAQQSSCDCQSPSYPGPGSIFL